MKMAATSVGLLALAGTIVPPAVFMTIMLVSTVAWFVAAPFWMKVE